MAIFKLSDKIISANSYPWGYSGAKFLQWTPAEITTALWLDADDSGTITLDGSDNVSQWNDKSGNNNHATQGTSSLRPDYLTGELNGGAVLDFSVTARMVHSFAAASAAVTIFAVVSVNTSTGYRGILSTNGSNSTQTLMLARGISSDYWGTYTGSSYVSANTNIQAQGWQTACILRSSGGSGTFYLNGATDGTFAGSEGQSGNVGGTPSGGQELDGKIAEIVVVDSEATESTRQKIEGYLAHKWGLEANLPAGHPYKSFAPIIT